MWTRYDENQRASIMAALDANGGNVRQTARETGVPEATLRAWKNGRAKPVSRRLYAEKVGDLRGGLLELAVALVDTAVTKAASGEGNIQQVVTALGIVFDKLQLLDEQPTERIAVVNESLTDDERTARTAALFDAARARRAGQASDRADWAD